MRVSTHSLSFFGCKLELGIVRERDINCSFGLGCLAAREQPKRVEESSRGA